MQRRLCFLSVVGTLSACAASAPRAVPPPPREPPVSPAAANIEPSDLDGDGVPDRDDECPFDPERHNGVRDADGCPDNGQPRFQPGLSLRIEQKVSFARNKTVVPPSSVGDLDAVVALARTHPEVLLIQVQGHATPDEKAPERIAEARAQVVRAQLAARGLSADRLKAIGAGTSVPLCVRPDDACVNANRRVDFLVLKRDDPKIAFCDRRRFYRVRLTFAEGPAAMDAASLRRLRPVVAYLTAHPAAGPLKIEGHAAFNEVDPLGISGGRATAVEAALVARGIPAHRLVPSADGSDLMCGPDRPECWALERYVDLWMRLPDLRDDECPEVGYGQ